MMGWYKGLIEGGMDYGISRVPLPPYNNAYSKGGIPIKIAGNPGFYRGGIGYDNIVKTAWLALL